MNYSFVPESEASARWMIFIRRIRKPCLALKKAEGTVMHINDLVAAQDIEENYPMETENAMYVALKHGDVSKHWRRPHSSLIDAEELCFLSG